MRFFCLLLDLPPILPPNAAKGQRKNWTVKAQKTPPQFWDNIQFFELTTLAPP